MPVEVFLDTNVLVYAVDSSDSEQTKRQQAIELIETRDFALSAQVLQEFYVTVTRKIATPLTPAQAIEWVEQLAIFPCIEIDASLVKIAIENSVRYKVSYWDAAIIAAAESSGANTLFSEDLNHGQHFGSVQVINPFIA